VRHALAIVAAASVACGQIGEEDEHPTDASVPDAVQCSVAPAEDPGEADRYAREVVFDVELDIEDVWWRGNALFVAGDELLVFTHRGAHRVTMDGTLISTTPFVGPAGAEVDLFHVVAGTDGYGAIVSISNGSYLCVLDAAGTLDLARCTQLESPYLEPIVFDGVAYRTYGSDDGVLRRSVYDSTATRLASDELPVAGVETGSVLAAGMSAGDEYVVAVGYTGAACGGFHEHVIESNGDHRIRAVFPEDVGASYGQPRVAASPAGAVAFVSHGGCLLGGCEGDRHSSRLLTIYQDAAVALDRHSIPKAEWAGLAAVFHDGDRIVTIDEVEECYLEVPPSCYRCSTRALLSRFALDGSTEVYGVEVVPWQVEGGDLAISTAMLGPGDYVIAYGGYRMRLTRVRIP
jgi:hypothetical protein